MDKHLEGKECIKCKEKLKESLVSMHTYIKCCSTIFSLDDDFKNGLKHDELKADDIEADMLYD